MPEKDLEVITATEDTSEEVSQIGTAEFVKALLSELHTKKLWRSVQSLATALHVDPKALKEWMDKDPPFVRKAGKTDGEFFYCWSDRLNAPAPKEIKQEVIREEERYALAILHMIYFNYHKALKTYGLEISQRDPEAFNYFALALDKLESGMVLFSTKTGANMEKLPKF